MNKKEVANEVRAIKSAFDTIYYASEDGLAAFIESCDDSRFLAFVAIHFSNQPKVWRALLMNMNATSYRLNLINRSTQENLVALVAEPDTPIFLLEEIAGRKDTVPLAAEAAAQCLGLSAKEWDELCFKYR